MNTTSLDIESLHRRASGHYLRGEFEDAMRVWRELLQHAPKDVRACEGVRLCEELSRQTPVEAPVVQPPEGSFVLDLPLAELAGPAGQGLRGAPPEIELEPDPPFAEEFPPPIFEDSGDAAALELQRRVEQLVEDAQECARRNEGIEALRIIERVLILDEENEAALALQARLTNPEPDADDGPSPDLDAEIASDPLPDLDDLAALEMEDEPAAPAFTGRPVDGTPAPAAEARPAVPAEAQAAVRPVKARRAWPRLGHLLPRGRATWIAGAVVLAGAIAAAAWLLWPHGGSPAQATSPPESRPESHRPRGHVAAERHATAPPVTPAAPVGQSLTDVIARGDAAVAAKDWAAAVLAYDGAAKLAPADLELRKKFQLAAAAYQVQQKEHERWDEALQAFAVGNYEETLRCLYRMPGSETDPRILDYKTRSWFNLGVTALRGHDCPAAASDFEEARGIRPADKEIQAALALAKDCGKANAVTFPLDVTALQLRQLVD